MAKDTNKQEDEVPITKAQTNLVLETVMKELVRREEEMHSDVYGSRPYSDGVRLEVRRMQEWLATQMVS